MKINQVCEVTDCDQLYAQNNNKSLGKLFGASKLKLFQKAGSFVQPFYRILIICRDLFSKTYSLKVETCTYITATEHI
jgi:hypothetical protein